MYSKCQCKDCADRHPSCHASCRAYAALRAFRDEYNANRQKYNAAKYICGNNKFKQAER